jgi:peroxiredoxin family protein
MVAESEERLTVVAWSGDLDRVWPQLILATTGAAYGMTTTVFFTFWGLFTLKRPEAKITGSDWKTKGLGVMNRQGLTKLNMGGIGPLLMRRVAAEHKVAPPAELIETAQELGVRLWPCSMTMDLMGLTPADLIDGVGEPVGAATALAEMQHSKINLFI